MAKKKYKPRKKKKTKKKSRNYLLIILLVLMVTLPLGLLFVVKYRQAHHRLPKGENTNLTNSNYLFGIDISHYQGNINWDRLKTSEHPIKYIFIRATMGKNGKDYHFKKNWKKAKTYGYVRGAYHFYRPNENSTLQFENFKSSVKLEKGDFIPVLDVEKESRFGRDNLREGVLNWLNLAEEEYGVKPMIYTGANFYKEILKGYVDDYPIWIAAYSGEHRLRNINWDFYQFSEEIIIKGIKGKVDGNFFKGNFYELQEYLIR